MSNKILVAGVGNIFLGDDAFGVEVVQRLSREDMPGNVVVRDCGIRSYDLAYSLMEDWELVILVDAVDCGGAPGTVYTIDPEIPAEADSTPLIDAHSMNPVAILNLVTALGGKVGRMLVVGCQPSTVEADEAGNLGLSAAVEVAVDEAVNVVKGLITRKSNALAA